MLTCTMLKYLQEKKADLPSWARSVLLRMSQEKCWLLSIFTYVHSQNLNTKMATEIELIKGFTESILGIGEVTLWHHVTRIFFNTIIPGLHRQSHLQTVLQMVSLSLHSQQCSLSSKQFLRWPHRLRNSKGASMRSEWRLESDPRSRCCYASSLMP